MLVPVLLISSCFGLAAISLLVFTSRRRRPPPGPLGLPWFGNAIGFHAKDAHKTFTEWNKTYGDTVMVKMFGKNVAILSHPDVIRQTFASAELSPFTNDRPPNFLGYYVADSYKDILFRDNDEICQNLKSIVVRASHAVGEGNATYEAHVQQEINNFICYVTSFGDGNVNILEAVELSMCKLIALLFTGTLPSKEDALLRHIRAFDHYGNQMIQPDVSLIFKLVPFVRHLPGKYGRLFRNVMRAKENLRQTLINEMKASFKQKTHTCLTHALFEIQEKEDWLTDAHVLGVLMDLINTSTLTSRGVLGGIFLLLVHFQDIQERIRQEIDRVVGTERQPSPADRDNMPFTHACILETLRYQSHLSLTATHFNAGRDVTLGEFTIPKGTAIFGNLWAVHHDERLWSDPWTFTPERFLQEDGTLLPTDHERQRRNFIPFGVGPRRCLGIETTYNRVFLFVTNILQKYQILPPVDGELPSHDPRELTSGTVLQAPEFTCRVVPRSN